MRITRHHFRRHHPHCCRRDNAHSLARTWISVLLLLKACKVCTTAINKQLSADMAHFDIGNAPTGSIIAQPLSSTFVLRRQARQSPVLASHVSSVTLKRHPFCYAPDHTEGAISVTFVRPSVLLSVRLSVAYIANNSKTQRPSVSKFGRKFPSLSLDATRTPVSRSNGQRPG